MFEEAWILKDPRAIKAVYEQLSQTKAERLFAQSQRILGKRPQSEELLVETVNEAIAQQLILLGLRSEFLGSCLPIKKTQLKNIQRNLERKGLLDGILHTKRILEEDERSVRWFLSKGRIVATLFLLFYRQLLQTNEPKRINLYFFVLSYLLTKEVFEHPQIAPIEMPELPVDIAFYFCHLATTGQVRSVYCSSCGQLYPVFSFEEDPLNPPECPYCHWLSIGNLDRLKADSIDIFAYGIG